MSYFQDRNIQARNFQARFRFPSVLFPSGVAKWYHTLWKKIPKSELSDLTPRLFRIKFSVPFRDFSSIFRSEIFPRKTENGKRNSAENGKLCRSLVERRHNLKKPNNLLKNNKVVYRGLPNGTGTGTGIRKPKGLIN